MGAWLGGDAGGVDQHGNGAVLLSLRNQGLNGCPGGQIHLLGHGVKARLVHDLGNGLSILRFLISNHDLHAIAHPAGDGHADLSGAR